MIRPDDQDAELLDLLLDTAGVPTVPRLVRRPEGTAPVLSAAQQRMWFLQQFDPASPAYNLVTAVRWHGALEVAWLEAAVNDVVQRHEVLRTAFASEDGRAVARFFADARVTVRCVTGDPASVQTEEAGRPFELSVAPLLRLAVARSSAAEHVVVLTMHHIVADGWSMDVLVREIGTAYRARAEGRPPTWPELPVQYADFAAWQHASLESGVRATQLAYWRRQLANPPTLALPTDRPRPARPDFAGAVHGFTLPTDVVAGVRRLAQTEDATLFMVLLAGFQALLHRLTGQDDLVVGAPVANRTRSELEPLIGFFVNTLVLRADLVNAATFRQLVQQVKRTAIDAYAHQDLPFEELVHELQPERHLSQNPLFQVMFSVQAAAREVLALPGVAIEALKSDARTAKFDLLLGFEEAADAIHGGIEYRTTLFDAATIERWALCLVTLLRAAVQAPDAPLRTLPLLPDSERRRLLVEWNPAGRDYPERSLAALFAEQVATSPDATALTCAGTRLTYAELDARSNRLAHVFVGAGIGPDVCVAVCLERSVELIVALLGIVKAGGAYAALEPDYPEERLQWMLADLAAPLVITSEPWGAKLQRVAGTMARPPTVLAFERERERIAAHPATAPAVAATIDDLAYVSYTSGSTGRPKGVAVPQRGVVRLVRGADYARFGADEVFLQFAPVAFDASTLEIWGPLLNGARLVVMPAGRPSLEELGRVVREERVTTLWLTAGLFRAMVEERLADLRGVKQLLAGGDVLPIAAVERVLRELPGCRLINGYGPTENTTFTCCHTVVAADLAGGSVPIGRPIAATTVQVLDAALQLVPVGVPGELFTGGDGLARGYVGQPALTAEKFLPNPFGAGRLYRTGDRVRWRADGTLEFLGRFDEQVKVRGFRIEPGEVEAALCAERGVAAAAVVVRADAGAKQLVGYVVAESDGESLRERLKARLPDYLVPAVIVRLEALPLTANGKIDRAALPAPGARLGASQGYLAPRNEPERDLAAVWSSVLGRTQVGVHDNYFALGGDSIGAIQVVSRLKRAGWQVDVRDLFQFPILAELALRLRRGADGGVEEGPIEGPVGPTPAQAWFLAQPVADRHHFNQAVLLRPRSDLRTDALTAAVTALWRQHDALRTVLREDVLQILPADTPPRVIELAVPDEPARCAHTESIHRSFDLERGPLFVAVLYRSVGGDRLLLAAHHLVIDGVSWRILLEDLERALRQHAAGQPIDLGPRTTSIRRWTEAAQARPSEPAEAWVLSEPVSWRPARTEEPNVFGATRTLSVRLEEELTGALLTRAGTAYGTRTDELLLLALARALRRWHGGERTRVLLEGHGRDPETGLPAIERTVGWFTCLYPVTIGVEGEDLGAQLKRLKEALRAVPAKGIGYGIARYLQRSVALANDPPPPVSFNYLGQFGDEAGGRLQLADESSGAPIGARVVRSCELDATAITVRGRMELTLTYGALRQPSAEMERVLSDWREEIATVVAHCVAQTRPEKTPADFTSPGLTLAGYEALLRARNWTAADVEDVCRLSPMQSGLLFQSLLETDSDAYFVQMAYRLRGAIDAGRLEAAWQAVGRRHAILRANIVHQDLDEPRLIVWRERRAEVATTDLRGLDAAEQRKRIAAARAADLARGFDLERDPLWRVTLFRTADDAVELVWSYHHVLLDGWSLGLVQRDLLAAYATAEQAREQPAPAAFRDYVRWLARRDPEASRGFWKTYLADFEQATGLPVLGARTAAAGYVAASHPLALGGELSRGLRALATARGVTLNTMLQAAWGIVLARYNRTGDVVFGAIVSGRPADLPGVEEMVGPFICAVPVRVRAEPTARLPELLRRLQDAALASEAHHHLPIAEIQTLTPLGRQLFDHLLVFENYPVDRGLAGAGEAGWRVEAVEAHDRTHYDLDVTVAPDEELTITFGFNRNVYPPEQVARVAEHLRRVLQQMVAAPEAQVADYDLATAEETRLVLETFNATAVPWPREQTLVDLLDEAARRWPERTAVVFGEEALSYHELHARADRLAAALRARGVGPEVLVGLLIERSAEMIVGVLGVLKAGGAYLPLDPAYPSDRLAFMIEDAKPRVIVTQRALAERVPRTAAGAERLLIDGELDVGAAATGGEQAATLRPEHLAYLIYTSGSTGKPKGVAVEHRSLVNAAMAWRVGYGLPAMDVRLLQLASLSFDVFAGDLIRTLTNGGMMVVCDAETRLDPAALCELLVRHRITFFESTPGLILPLMEHVRLQGVKLPDLRILVLGSDTLAIGEYRRLLADFGAAMRIVNSYGVTEATIDTSFFESRPGAPELEELGEGSTPIGRPMANQELHVLDARLRPCPPGVVGELFIGGAGVARGYHARPELNAERFVCCELGGEPRRLYRTGDLARWRADGNVDFLGRGDWQAKVRGFRVEPGEVEAVLRRHANVRDVVVGVRVVGGANALVAYVVAAEWTPAEWRAHVLAELPDYMVPAYWVKLERLPLSPNGKIDRRALPAPGAEAAVRGTAFVAPRTPVEEQLAAIWREVLQVERVGVEDDFFELGGHSLKAMQVATRVQQAFGVRPALRAFFAAPTIAALAQTVGATATGAAQVMAIPRAEPRADYELSFAQQRLWLLHQLGGASAYNMPEAYMLNTRLDADALERAFQQLVARHEALRTAFVVVNGEPRQRIHAQVPFALRRIDLSREPAPDERARELADREAAAPFDLTQPPLLRATLVTLGAERCAFLFTMHHIVGDGWSGNVLYRELFALYAACRAGAPDPLPPLRIHYKDFAVWQKTQRFDADEAYWLTALRGAPAALMLPYDFPPRAERDFRGDVVRGAIAPAQLVGLQRLARERRTTVANVVLAVFKLVLFQITKQEDFCVGVSIANRQHADLENLIGFFVNILPVRARLNEAMEFDELLAQVSAAATAAFEHQEYPFDLLVQKLNPLRASNRQPLLNVIYGYQNFSDVHVAVGGAATAGAAGEPALDVTPLAHAFRTSKFDLTLFVGEEAGGLALTLEYDTGLFRAETARRYVELLERFAGMVADAATDE
ncbi:non-ribosomal peptide synthetase [Opitutus terrae]|uniref:Amino acid adenylation domain protein n=1 Tax=Opitutus terrae (strain DSM 11246 / JCM 15787 / PB90-1) TaxID=452637 RepID=B1ZYL9_OPITP|nr:non-ribosomal peptide synthetase [Opitutus terrae]ACB75255.1 amino acid adenylation domain protein [Opitutus terrae PB90-1]